MMAFTLVLTGEHFVVDVFIGWGYTAAVVVLWDRIERWRDRKASPSPTSSTSTPDPDRELEPSRTAMST